MYIISLLFFFFLAALGLRCCVRASLVAARGGYSSLQCAGFSLQWLLLLWSTCSRRTGFSSCDSQALEYRLSSCGARAQLLRGMWDPPGPGLEPVSPALAGGFLTTAPPGKPLFPYFLKQFLHISMFNQTLYFTCFLTSENVIFIDDFRIILSNLPLKKIYNFN